LPRLCREGAFGVAVFPIWQDKSTTKIANGANCVLFAKSAFYRMGGQVPPCERGLETIVAVVSHDAIPLGVASNGQKPVS